MEKFLLFVPLLELGNTLLNNLSQVEKFEIMTGLKEEAFTADVSSVTTASNEEVSLFSFCLVNNFSVTLR